MKIPVMFFVGLATLLLVMLTVMVSLDMPFGMVFYTMCFGQVVVLIMVYKVLTDEYNTDKTFDDLYEDRPI